MKRFVSLLIASFENEPSWGKKIFLCKGMNMYTKYVLRREATRTWSMEGCTTVHVMLFNQKYLCILSVNELNIGLLRHVYAYVCCVKNGKRVIPANNQFSLIVTARNWIACNLIAERRRKNQRFMYFIYFNSKRHRLNFIICWKDKSLH